jgi:carbonic anhydrase
VYHFAVIKTPATKPPAHFAKNVLFACIDDRLVESHMKQIIKLGGAFYSAIAGGGLSFVSKDDSETALKQVAASYAINHVKDIYIESHLECGAYRLSGAVFSSREEELSRLYRDLDDAKALVESTLIAQGATLSEVNVHTSVVDLEGNIVPRP